MDTKCSYRHLRNIPKTSIFLMGQVVCKTTLVGRHLDMKSKIISVDVLFGVRTDIEDAVKNVKCGHQNAAL